MNDKVHVHFPAEDSDSFSIYRTGTLLDREEGFATVRMNNGEELRVEKERVFSEEQFMAMLVRGAGG